jgi:hypothetical protein
MWSERPLNRLAKKIASGLLFAACGLAIIAGSAGIARAQNQSQDQSAPPPPPPGDVMYQRTGHGPMPPDAIEFVGFQAGIDDKVVTGAPFSATITTESKQTLSDGNLIQRNSTGSLARDTQGRTRRDMVLPAFGPLAESGKPAPHVVSVNDPVASARYLLDVDNKTARKMQIFSGDRGAGRKPHEGFRLKATVDNETVTTSLGTQTIGGVSAEGTRYTRTIPTGQIGNAKPIVVVTERWYSPDLQMVVMTKHTDPRMGETTFQMTNIQRQEPAATLFQVPADYTVTQGDERGERRAHPALPPPPVEQ